MRILKFYLSDGAAFATASRPSAAERENYTSPRDSLVGGCHLTAFGGTASTVLRALLTTSVASMLITFRSASVADVGTKPADG